MDTQRDKYACICTSQLDKEPSCTDLQPLANVDEAVDEFDELVQPFLHSKGESQQTMLCHFNLTQA